MNNFAIITYRWSKTYQESGHTLWTDTGKIGSGYLKAKHQRLNSIYLSNTPVTNAGGQRRGFAVRGSFFGADLTVQAKEKVDRMLFEIYLGYLLYDVLFQKVIVSDEAF